LNDQLYTHQKLISLWLKAANSTDPRQWVVDFWFQTSQSISLLCLWTWVSSTCDLSLIPFPPYFGHYLHHGPVTEDWGKPSTPYILTFEWSESHFYMGTSWSLKLCVCGKRKGGGFHHFKPGKMDVRARARANNFNVRFLSLEVLHSLRFVGFFFSRTSGSVNHAVWLVYGTSLAGIDGLWDFDGVVVWQLYCKINKCGKTHTFDRVRSNFVHVGAAMRFFFAQVSYQATKTSHVLVQAKSHRFVAVNISHINHTCALHSKFVCFILTGMNLCSFGNCSHMRKKTVWVNLREKMKT